MNPEPTKELKEKYFAAHWGCEAIFVKGTYTNPSGSTRQVDGSFLKYFAGEWGKIKTALYLRSVSAITDAEAIEVAKIFGEEDVYVKPDGSYDRGDLMEFVQALLEEIPGCFINSYPPRIYIEFFDYLRSISVALPFCGHSVNQLIDYGWLKLREGGVSK